MEQTEEKKEPEKTEKTAFEEMQTMFEEKLKKQKEEYEKKLEEKEQLLKSIIIKSAIPAPDKDLPQKIWEKVKKMRG